MPAPAFAIPFPGLPVALYLLFGVVFFGNALRNDPKGALFVFTGFDAFGVMGPGLRAVGAASHGAPLLHIAVLAGVTMLLGMFAIRRLARVG